MSATPFTFSSKADTLVALSRWPELNIPAVFAFTVAQWRADAGAVRDAAVAALAPEGPLRMAVRSSCRREDSAEGSGAGAFLSRLDVPLEDAAAFARAVDEVIASYGEAAPEDQVLVQPMIREPAVTGVIMTRALADGAPWYVINYDDESGQTDTVTGGTHVGKTVYVYRDATERDFDSPRLAAFVALARRLEALCGTDALDIEFCLDRENVLHLLQVRPICAVAQWPDSIPAARIGRVADFVAGRTGPCPGLFGQRSILGVMPDWNPAEMIGILPRPLAASLYRNLITSRVWSKARGRMGYRALPPTELMPLIFGRPYIDVRASFNSFLPAGLAAATCELLVDAWLERLEANPQFHDKIEFEIAQTALDFSFDATLDARYPGLLTTRRREGFRAALTRLTADCLDLSTSGTLAQALDAVAELRGRQATRPFVTAEAPGRLEDLTPLLAECRKYGTLPFSILARHAFIAESLLRSAVAAGALAPERVQAFKGTIRTISGELSGEFQEVCEGRRDAAAFMRKYGHLRPGSYDILSPRYLDRPDIFGDRGRSSRPEPGAPFALTGAERRGLEALLRGAGLPGTPEELLEYARRAIAGREHAKFIFSRNLSDILEIIAFSAARAGLDREAASFLEIQPLLDWTTSAQPETAHEHFSRLVAANRELLARASGLKLGYLIRSVRDVYVAPQHRAAPNFVGSGEALAPVARLFAGSPCDVDLTDKIVCIENADPGFDWIFTRNIAGLVTRFGGANSHMAIRCAEYGLPAAIGAGERLFDMAQSAETLYLKPAAAILEAR
ncbi:MAG: pyruvate, phosphate dikinase [Desulfovibrio sp.]|nr:pyruvate, phosphate dikinase [Desulfovibrio sp.]